MKVVFAEWTPDILDVAAPTNLEEATNVLPEIDGYSVARGAMVLTEAMEGKCLGGAWFSDDQGAAQTFAGTGAELLKLTDPTTWTVVTNTTDYPTGYAATDWQFVSWGNDVIATNGSCLPQVMDMTSGTEFDDLAATAPIAATVAVVSDFLVFGRTEESSVAYPARVRWSGFNSATTWGSSLATQADYQDLLGNGGQVQKIVSGPVGVIFQERAIWTMEYAGPPTIFRFTEVERAKGTPAPNSVCSLGTTIFYYSTDGFQAFTLGGGSQPLGRGRVDKWFLANCDTSRITEMRGCVDRERNRVYWSFPSTSAGTNCDKMIVYSIAANKWSVVELETECIFEIRSPGYNLDTLDGILTDIDTDSFYMESRAFLDGALMVAVVDSAHKMGTMEGAPLTAVVQTGEFGGEGKQLLRRVIPIVEGGTARARIGYRDRISENTNWTLDVDENARGVVPFRINARYHRIRMEIPDGFDMVHGANIEFA